MAEALTLARSEFILGGQKSGKSRRAELLARDWLAQSTQHKAVFIATAQAWDDEMRERIARHQRDRAERVPGMTTVEEPLHLADAIAQHSQPDTLVVVDCLTLWLTNWLMPVERVEPFEVPETAFSSQKKPSKSAAAQYSVASAATFLIAVSSARGPVILVGNEIGLGVIPMGSEVRAFVDALGRLNQDVAQVCTRVTLMAAGLPLTLKEEDA
jgi:adenosylcobinamide kinase / adenosylcobinamide-phosphate guanylyltransferase